MTETGNPMVVVIDDSAEDRFFLSRAIRKVRPDAQIEEFTYSEDALLFLIGTPRPDVMYLFVDINIPRMDGFEFITAYGADLAQSRFPPKLIVMSSSIDPNDRERAEAHDQIHAFVSKPVTAQMLSQIL